MAAGISLKHLQVAGLEADPEDMVWVDNPAIISWGPTIASNRMPLQADGGIFAVAYGSRDGSTDIVSAFLSFPFLQVVNNGEFSTFGTLGTKIDRYEMTDTPGSPPFAASGFYFNEALDKDPTTAAVRITTPNNTAAPVTAPLAQEAWINWTAASSFLGDTTDGTMIIYEKMATAPVVTAGVMPVNLARPS